HPQGTGLDQGARSGGREGGDRPIRLHRFGGDARRHPRHRAQARNRKAGRERKAREGTGLKREPGRIEVSRAMSLVAATMVARRRTRRKLAFWGVRAIIVAICAVIAIGAALRVPGADVLVGTPAGSIARLATTGLTRTDLQRVEALERLGKSRAR